MDKNKSKRSEGRGFHKSDDPTGKVHAAAGRKGGQATAESHGPDFYSEIGRKGGQASPTKFKKGDKRTKELAREGGQARGNNNK